MSPVLGNSRKHELERTGEATIPTLSEPHGSAPWFEELLDPYEGFPPGEPPIASPAQGRPTHIPPLTSRDPAGFESQRPR